MSNQAVGNYVVRFIGTALIGSGAYGLINPLEMNKMFGVPAANAQTALMYPGIGGRNLAAGLAVWSLSLAREQRALGIFLLCWGLVVGPSDTTICLKTKTKRADHLLNTVIVSLTGWLALNDFAGEAGKLIWGAAAVFAFSVGKTIFS